MWHIPSQKRLDAIPRLYETEGIAIEKKLIHLYLHIFNSEWFVCEFDGVDTCFGYAILNGDLINSEWGYFSFSELKAIEINSFQIYCESEYSWRIRPVSEVDKIQL